MIFLTPEGFAGGGIDNILRVALKGSEQEAGSPLIGIPAKIADGFFLVALNDSKAETDANLTLLRRQAWIDIPVVYKSGRRALFTMEKGIPGDKVFDEALKAWAAASAGSSDRTGLELDGRAGRLEVRLTPIRPLAILSPRGSPCFSTYRFDASMDVTVLELPQPRFFHGLCDALFGGHAKH